MRFPQEEFGDEVRPEEWLACIAKYTKEHRPFILTIDDGIRGNALSTKKMKETGCCFVHLARAWLDQPFDAFSWRIIKAWPEILRVSKLAYENGRQCRLDVTIQGKVHIVNF